MLTYPEYYKEVCFDYPGCYQKPFTIYNQSIDKCKQLYTEVEKEFANDNIIYPKEYGVSVDNDNLLRLRNFKELKTLQPIVEDTLLNVEHLIYSSAVHLHRIYIYKTLAKQIDLRSSFLWHFDNHPREVYKIMIYLNDVDEKTAPFELLLDKFRQPKLMKSFRDGKQNTWKSVSGRFSQKEIDVFYPEYAPTKILGRAGTTIIFDNNCIHKANLAEKERVVCVLQVRPSFSSKWDIDKAGGFGDDCITLNPDPSK